jgi:hypothetical protein
MEEVTFQTATRDLQSSLEAVLSKMAVAADAGISTYRLEPEAQKLAAKLRSAAQVFGTASLYKGVEGDKVYWPEEMPTSTFVRYAKLCKDTQDPSMDVVKAKGSGEFFAKLDTGLYVRLTDLPEQTVPEFRVKLEGNTLMAVRADLLDKLPKSAQKLLQNVEEEYNANNRGVH